MNLLIQRFLLFIFVIATFTFCCRVSDYLSFCRLLTQVTSPHIMASVNHKGFDKLSRHVSAD